MNLDRRNKKLIDTSLVDMGFIEAFVSDIYPKGKPAIYLTALAELVKYKRSL